MLPTLQHHGRPYLGKQRFHFSQKHSKTSVYRIYVITKPLYLWGKNNDILMKYFNFEQLTCIIVSVLNKGPQDRKEVHSYE